MKTTTKILNVISILVLCIFFSSTAYSETVNDADALKGYGQGKIVFDINLKEGKALMLYLQVIKQTHADLEKQKITPDIVLAFRGLAVTLVQKGSEKDSGEQQKLSGQINTQINQLQSMGVKMEVCSVATGLFQVPNDRILPGMKIVGNTFVSLMGYQHQGYAIIPIM
jgi:intracellular sulfur oxidation DsrE/DsrF family protein